MAFYKNQSASSVTLNVNDGDKKSGKKQHCSQPLEGEKKKVIESDGDSEHDEQSDYSTQVSDKWSVVEKGKKEKVISSRTTQP